jgi:recombinational DNA repair protein (RecF pathway)
MPYLRDRAIVLKKEPFREQDRRYTLYGSEHGLLHAVARGSSLKSSKQAGHLEPFCEIEVMIAKGSSFDKLAVARSVGIPPPRDLRLAAFAILGAFHDLVISLTRPGISDERMYELLMELRAVCFSFPAEPSPERSRLLYAAATLKLLDLIGFAPPLDRDHAVAVLIAFIRRSPLADVLRVTATTTILNDASSWIEEALRHTPLHEAPKGPHTIRALLLPVR